MGQHMCINEELFNEKLKNVTDSLKRVEFALSKLDGNLSKINMQLVANQKDIEFLKAQRLVDIENNNDKIEELKTEMHQRDKRSITVSMMALTIVSTLSALFSFFILRK